MIDPTLSVVVTSYNYGQYLPECLRAIFEQDFMPLEVLVIDDASTDDSVQIAEGFQKRHSHLRLLRNQTNQGILAVLNRALHEARGGYILFAAADDWILPGLLSRSMELLRAFPEAALCSALSLQVTDENAKLFYSPSLIALDRPGYIPPCRVVDLLLSYDNWFLSNTIVLRRRAALEMGGFRPELFSFCDGFLYKQMALKYGACFIPAPLAVWRRHGTSYSAASSVNLERVLAIYHEATRLMTEDYSTLFPSKYIARWQSRWRYMALKEALSVGNYRAEEMGQLWPNAKPLDKFVLNLANNIGAAARRLSTVYIFSRLRWRDFLPTLQRRFLWTIRRIAVTGKHA